MVVMRVGLLMLVIDVSYVMLGWIVDIVLKF